VVGLEGGYVLGEPAERWLISHECRLVLSREDMPWRLRVAGCYKAYQTLSVGSSWSMYAAKINVYESQKGLKLANWLGGCEGGERLGQTSDQGLGRYFGLPLKKATLDYA
jgi:hypothetical protein